MTCPNKFDTNCIKNLGYQTSNMVKTPCPAVMNCTQFLALSPGAQNLATNVDQSCTSNADTGASTSTTSPTSTGLSSGMLILLFIIFLIVVALIYVAYRYFHVPTTNISPTNPAPVVKT